MNLSRKKPLHRRASDRWHDRLGAFWDWIDRRDIDKHAVSLIVLWGTVEVTKWAMTYAATHAGKPGTDVGLIIAAVTAPYCLLQGAAIRWYFEARK